MNVASTLIRRCFDAVGLLGMTLAVGGTLNRERERERERDVFSCCVFTRLHGTCTALAVCTRTFTGLDLSVEL